MKGASLQSLEKTCGHHTIQGDQADSGLGDISSSPSHMGHFNASRSGDGIFLVPGMASQESRFSNTSKKSIPKSLFNCVEFFS